MDHTLLGKILRFDQFNSFFIFHNTQGPYGPKLLQGKWHTRSVIALGSKLFPEAARRTWRSTAMILELIFVAHLL